MKTFSISAAAIGLVGTIVVRSDAQGPPSRVNASRVTGAQGQTVAVPERLPGSAVMFPLPDPHPPPHVFMRPHGAATPVWTVAAKPVTLSDVHGKFGVGASLGGVGFDVPQLPRGVYDAWYVDGHPSSAATGNPSRVAPADTKASQSITLAIKPRLHAQRATVYGTPGSELDVAIGIVGPISVPPSTTAPGRVFDPVAVTLTGTTQPVRATVGSDGLAHFGVRISSTGIFDLGAAAPGFDSTTVRVVGGQTTALRTSVLQPGDVLLHAGDSWESSTIIIGETLELGSNGAPVYSHAGLYIGRDAQGVDQTIEMLDGGWTERSLLASVGEDIAVDVYRRPGLTDAQRHSIVSAATAYGNRLGGLPYAHGQILVLGASVDSIGLIVGDEAKWADFFDAGKERMICSELVAWAYNDAGLRLTVRPWPDVASNGLLSSLDRWMDYTTPNMLARSPDLKLVAHLWPTVLDEKKNADGTCPRGYMPCGAVCQVGWSQCRSSGG